MIREPNSAREKRMIRIAKDAAVIVLGLEYSDAIEEDLFWRDDDQLVLSMEGGLPLDYYDYVNTPERVIAIGEAMSKNGFDGFWECETPGAYNWVDEA